MAGRSWKSPIALSMILVKGIAEGSCCNGCSLGRTAHRRKRLTAVISQPLIVREVLKEAN